MSPGLRENGTWDIALESELFSLVMIKDLVKGEQRMWNALMEFA